MTTDGRNHENMAPHKAGAEELAGTAPLSGWVDGPDEDQPPNARTPLLVNATKHPYWVETTRGRVRLPEVPPPSICDGVPFENEEVQTFRVVGPEGEDEFHLRVGPAEGVMTVDLPEPTLGVVYLVEVDILLRLPHRTDLMKAASLRWHDSAAHDIGVSSTDLAVAPGVDDGAGIVEQQGADEMPWCQFTLWSAHSSVDTGVSLFQNLSLFS